MRRGIWGHRTGDGEQCPSQHWARSLSLLTVMIASIVACSTMAAQTPQGTDEPGRWAILVCGISGDPELQGEYLKQLAALYDLLSGKFGFAKDSIYYLFDDPSKDPVRIRYKSTWENLGKTCKEVAGKAGKGDLVFVFIAGHGSFEGKTYKLNLVGPDPTAEELAGLIYSIPTQRFMIVNSTNCSGGSLAALARKGTVLLSATKSGNERNQTHFAGYFIEALTNNAGDTDKNGRVSMLEAFAFANRKVEEFYSRDGNLQTEHPVFSQGSDGQIHTMADAGGDAGLALANSYLQSSMLLASGQTMGPEEQSLAREAESLENRIEALKREKQSLAAAEYDEKLEALLIRLAQVQAKLREKQK